MEDIARVVKIVVVAGLALFLLIGTQVMLGGKVARLMKKHRPTLRPVERRMEAMLLKEQDLPPGWRFGEGQVEEEEGAEARFYWYYHTSAPDKTWVNITQEMLVYPEAHDAAAAYDRRLKEYNEAWITPPDLEDVTARAERMYIACYPGYINDLHHYACEANGLYGDVVVVLGGNVFEDRWLTMEDFRVVLEVMDKRVASVQDDKR